MNAVNTTDYGLVCLDASTPAGVVGWNLGVEGEFRGVAFSQASPSTLHDFLYWSTLPGGYRMAGYSANYTLSW